MWPRNLSVKGVSYKIVYKSVVLCSDDKEVDGTCDGITKTIEVSTACEPYRQLEILIHEFGHAVEIELGLEHVRDSESGPYEIHLLIDHLAKEIARNWHKFVKIRISK